MDTHRVPTIIYTSMTLSGSLRNARVDT